MAAICLGTTLLRQSNSPQRLPNSVCIYISFTCSLRPQIFSIDNNSSVRIMEEINTSNQQVRSPFHDIETPHSVTSTEKNEAILRKAVPAAWLDLKSSIWIMVMCLSWISCVYTYDYKVYTWINLYRYINLPTTYMLWVIYTLAECMYIIYDVYIYTYIIYFVLHKNEHDSDNNSLAKSMYRIVKDDHVTFLSIITSLCFSKKRHWRRWH